MLSIMVSTTFLEIRPFFQAEDGIRDSVASRGLGDVYKRQKVRQWNGYRGKEGSLDRTRSVQNRPYPYPNFHNALW